MSRQCKRVALARGADTLMVIDSGSTIVSRAIAIIKLHHFEDAGQSDHNCNLVTLEKKLDQKTVEDTSYCEQKDVSDNLRPYARFRSVGD